MPKEDSTIIVKMTKKEYEEYKRKRAKGKKIKTAFQEGFRPFAKVRKSIQWNNKQWDINQTDQGRSNLVESRIQRKTRMDLQSVENTMNVARYKTINRKETYNNIRLKQQQIAQTSQIGAAISAANEQTKKAESVIEERITNQLKMRGLQIDQLGRPVSIANTAPLPVESLEARSESAATAPPQPRGLFSRLNPWGGKEEHPFDSMSPTDIGRAVRQQAKRAGLSAREKDELSLALRDIEQIPQKHAAAIGKALTNDF